MIVCKCWSKGKTMKAKWIVSAIMASGLIAPAIAQVGVYIGRTPPPLRYEVQGSMPGPGYVWTEGYWAGRREVSVEARNVAETSL